jgi:acyl dehydratase
MIELESLADYGRYIGHVFAPSDWVMIDQKMINDFAEATWDRNWYHVDVERARRELPGGRTIAHGLLTLSLVPALGAQVIRMKHHGRALNYGFDRVRYPTPVPVDSRIRLHMRVVSVESAKGGTLIKKGYTMELEGDDKPALVTDMLMLAFG